MIFDRLRRRAVRTFARRVAVDLADHARWNDPEHPDAAAAFRESCRVVLARAFPEETADSMVLPADPAVFRDALRERRGAKASHVGASARLERADRNLAAFFVPHR